MEDIAVRVKQVIKKTGLTREAFAKSVDYSLDYIYKVISAGLTPSDKFIKKVEDKHNINREWLLFGTGNMEIIRISGCDVTSEEERIVLKYRKLNSAERACIENSIDLFIIAHSEK